MEVVGVDVVDVGLDEAEIFDVTGEPVAHGHGGGGDGGRGGGAGVHVESSSNGLGAPLGLEWTDQVRPGKPEKKIVVTCPRAGVHLEHR